MHAQSLDFNIKVTYFHFHSYSLFHLDFPRVFKKFVKRLAHALHCINRFTTISVSDKIAFNIEFNHDAIVNVYNQNRQIFKFTFNYEKFLEIDDTAIMQKLNQSLLHPITITLQDSYKFLAYYELLKFNAHIIYDVLIEMHNIGRSPNIQNYPDKIYATQHILNLFPGCKLNVETKDNLVLGKILCENFVLLDVVLPRDISYNTLSLILKENFVYD